MKNILTIFSILLFLSSTTSLLAQGTQELYSFSLKKTGTEFEISLPRYLSNYNNNSYNNQPYFKDTRSLMVTSQLIGESQTDIFSLNVFKRTKAKVTATPESEYSPQQRPNTNSFNCVRVESDGKTQRLWEFPNSHETQGNPLFPEIKNVGYYHWLNQYQVALFLVGEPHSLAIGDTRDDSIQHITSNIGRGMGSTLNGNLLFIQKLSESSWYIKQLDPATQKSTIVLETLDEAEDFLVLSSGALLMAQGAKIFYSNPAIDREWKEIADLSSYGLKKITRMAFNGERLLVVVNDPK